MWNKAALSCLTTKHSAACIPNQMTIMPGHRVWSGSDVDFEFCSICRFWFEHVDWQASLMLKCLNTYWIMLTCRSSRLYMCKFHDVHMGSHSEIRLRQMTLVFLAWVTSHLTILTSNLKWWSDTCLRYNEFAALDFAFHYATLHASLQYITVHYITVVI